MKYIMFQDSNGIKTPIIFPNNMVHSQVASKLQEILKDSVVVSAGEISFKVHKCYGHSTTLQMGVRKGDATLIHEYDYFHGLPNETGIKIP